MESLAPALVDEMELLVDLMPDDTTCWCSTPSAPAPGPTTWSRPARSSSAPAGRPRRAAASRRSTSAPRRTARSPTSASTPSSAASAWWTVSPFGIETPEDVGVDLDVVVGAVRSRALAAQPAEAYRGDIERAVADIRGWLADGYRVTVVHPGHGPAERMVEVLGEHDIPARLVADATEDPAPSADGVVTVTTGCLIQGFVDPRRGSPWSPARTCPGRRPRPATCARCRPAARSRSTRSSSRPATTSSTSSTASAASSR